MDNENNTQDQEQTELNQPSESSDNAVKQESSDNAEETESAENPDGDNQTTQTQSVDFTAFAAAIAAAEERGYQRGCAQAAAEKAKTKTEETKPSHTYEVPAGDNNQNNSTPTFLSHIRTGFWD